MKNYRFETTATMKEYNCKKWWIDGKIIPSMTIEAETVNDALVIFCKRASDKHYIDISKNALKNKSEMYVDDANGEAVQVGYVVTGSCDFERGNYEGWSKQYIDLWVHIDEIVNAEF